VDIYILYGYRKLGENKVNIFPHRAYQHADDAKINCDILKARNPDTDFLISKVTAPNNSLDDIFLITESKVNHMYPIKAFPTRGEGRNYIYSPEAREFSQLQLDCLTVA